MGHKMGRLGASGGASDFERKVCVYLVTYKIWGVNKDYLLINYYIYIYYINIYSIYREVAPVVLGMI